MFLLLCLSLNVLFGSFFVCYSVSNANDSALTYSLPPSPILFVSVRFSFCLPVTVAASASAGFPSSEVLFLISCILKKMSTSVFFYFGLLALFYNVYSIFQFVGRKPVNQLSCFLQQHGKWQHF